MPPLTNFGGIGTQNKNPRRLRQGGSGVAKFVTSSIGDMTSSENSVSVDASHSEDEIQVRSFHI